MFSGCAHLGPKTVAVDRFDWFWIDDGDWQTKRALTAVMFFFTLAETGAPEKLPFDHHPGAVICQ